MIYNLQIELNRQLKNLPGFHTDLMLHADVTISLKK